MDFLKRTWVEINLDNAKHNLNAIRRICNKPIIAIIKANAYGHGAVEMARFYSRQGVNRFAVSNIEEAIELRRAGITGEILILGFTPCHMADELAKYDLVQTILSADYARELSEKAQTELRIHIKLDTGMGRIGLCCLKDTSACIAEIHEILRLPRLKFEGLFTHFSSADSLKEDDRDYTGRQYALFSRVAESLKAEGYSFLAHCSNSAATLLDTEMCCDAVRPGIILYGLSPAADLPLPIELRPVMTLKTTVAMVKQIEAGVSISYGRLFTSSGPMTVATLPVGYADGYLRAFSDKAEVLIRGRRAKVLGRVCMDQIMVDVTGIPDVREGEEVVLFGEAGITANDLALQADTIGYELLCGIARRVPRVYMEGGKILDVHAMI